MNPGTTSDHTVSAEGSPGETGTFVAEALLASIDESTFDSANFTIPLVCMCPDGWSRTAPSSCPEGEELQSATGEGGITCYACAPTGSCCCPTETGTACGIDCCCCGRYYAPVGIGCACEYVGGE